MLSMIWLVFVIALDKKINRSDFYVVEDIRFEQMLIPNLKGIKGSHSKNIPL